MSTPLLSVTGLSVAYGGVAAVAPLSFAVAPGDYKRWLR